MCVNVQSKHLVRDFNKTSCIQRLTLICFTQVNGSSLSHDVLIKVHSNFYKIISQKSDSKNDFKGKPKIYNFGTNSILPATHFVKFSFFRIHSKIELQNVQWNVWFAIVNSKRQARY